MIEMFACLLFFHFLLDYPLQGDFLSKAKNHIAPIQHVPWYQAMFAHTAMHGFAVYWITNLWFLGAAEMLIHWWADYNKCKGELTYNVDQATHVVCKLMWACLAVYVFVGAA